jgi:hypothetical protein
MLSMHEVGVQPTVTSFSNIMKFAREQRMEAMVLHLWDDMRASAVLPDVECSICFVEAASRAGNRGMQRFIK